VSHWILIGVSFVTSAFTAVVGMGGGLMLISIMPGLVPTPAIVPVHGVVQLASNASRVAFDVRSIQWRVVGPFVVGSAIGAALGAPVLARVPTDYLPIVLGAFVLLVTWVPMQWAARDFRGKWPVIGAVSSALALFVGAAGPLTQPVLMREELPRDRLVVTGGVLAGINHVAKIITYAVLGFVFAPYLWLMAGMIVAVTAGSWVGTRLRGRVSERVFRWILRGMLTLLALRMIAKATVLPWLP